MIPTPLFGVSSPESISLFLLSFVISAAPSQLLSASPLRQSLVVQITLKYFSFSHLDSLFLCSM